jgi:hypothetical protein
MPEFPTPTPFVTDSTAVPTMVMNYTQDIAVNAVQAWNLVPPTGVLVLQAIIILAIVFGGVMFINRQLEHIE